MAIRLAYLYKKAERIYSMRLIAGEGGINHIVQWVHMLEDETAATFLRGGELVFTTGIGHKDEDWLLPFAKGLVEHNAAGFIINLGPYITQTPPELIQYCREQDFPLFTIPWEIHLVDVTRYFCRCIIHREQKDLNVSEAFKTAIFFPDKNLNYQIQLESHGYTAHRSYCAAVLSVQTDNDETTEKVLTDIHSFSEIVLHHMADHFCVFNHNKQLIIIFANTKDESIEKCLQQILNHCEQKKHPYPCHIGVGQNKSGLLLLSKSYKQAISVLRLAQKNSIGKIYYNDIGIYKILLSSGDVNVLYEIYNDTLGSLLDYDAANKTDYVSTLKCYLENDASVQVVAQKTFVHRNTINYKLKKIKEIINCPLNSAEDRLRILLAYKIKDIL
ncbi:MAG: transcriptional regulator, PucR family [Firmicutes bacterium]|nr:transcriptional regulator, PucR family [Bacillota bacterium]